MGTIDPAEQWRMIPRKALRVLVEDLENGVNDGDPVAAMAITLLRLADAQAEVIAGLTARVEALEQGS